MNKYILPLFFAIAGNASGQAGASLFALGGNLANPATQIPGNNPAYCGPQNQSIGAWSMSPFTGTSLFNGGIFGHFTRHSSGWGISARFSGTGYFLNQNTEAFTSLKIADNLEAGIAGGYQLTRQAAGYGNSYSPTAKIGLYSKPTGNTEISCVISNPWIKPEGQNQMARADISAGLKLDDATTVYGQFNVVINEPATYGLAMVYSIKQRIRVLAALQNGMQPVSAGIEFTDKHLNFCLATRYHTYLGFSPSVTLAWH